jgi:hypothetical protein
MQQHKSTNKFSEIELFAKDSDTLTSTLSEVMDKFNIKSHLAPFDALKSKGVAISNKKNLNKRKRGYNSFTARVNYLG